MKILIYLSDSFRYLICTLDILVLFWIRYTVLLVRVHTVKKHCLKIFLVRKQKTNIIKITKFCVDLYEFNSIYDAEIVLRLLCGFLWTDKKTCHAIYPVSYN